MADQLTEAIQAFAGGGPCRSVPLGRGNINDTYLVECQRQVGKRFVLQRINGKVFPEPLKVIRNFRVVSEHIRVNQRYSESRLQVAEPVFTCGGDLSFCDSEGGWWRAQSYFADFVPFSLNSSGNSSALGRNLAEFHRYLANLAPEIIDDPLPGFHELDLYLRSFDHALSKRSNLAENSETLFCLETIDRLRHRALALTEAIKAGLLPCQPIHGDPKNDNFLLHSGCRMFAIIDLDTVRPGCIQLDIGDCLRSISNRGGEADSIRPVELDLAVCHDFIEGYVGGAGRTLTMLQRSYFYDALLGIAFELGVRLLTDHFNGDIYFKVQQRGDNLLRAVRQLQLAEEIGAKESEFRKILL
jgi:hypothetical protein